MTMTVGGTTGLTFPDSSTQNTAATGFGFKNRIINGAMMIDQRNDGASVTLGGGTAAYTLDRWNSYCSAASKLSMQQNAGSVTPPTGFTNYLGLTSLSAYAVTSSDEFEIYQPIEGFNVADLGWGAANASSVTLSFWVRSSLTGTFGGSIQNAGAARSYVFSYTISAANTWEQKTITIAGDTTGTWNKTNGAGLSLFFGLGQGSTRSNTAGSWVAGNYNNVTGATSVVGTNGATFYITGVQLEKGSTATSFDYRPYPTELALCQRYYYQLSAANGNQTPYLSCWYNGQARVNSLHPVVMRASPTLTFTGTTGNGDWFSTIDDSAYRNFGSPANAGCNNITMMLRFTDSGGGMPTPATGAAYIQNGRSMYVSAEL